MNHEVAERLLPSLPDGLLPPRTEAAVRAHVAGCQACQRTLAELEAIDALLRRMPASVLPRRWTPASEARLESLARWAPRRPRRPDARPPWPALAAFAAGACLALGLALGLQPEPMPVARGLRAYTEHRSAEPPEIVLASSEGGEARRPVRSSRPGPAPGTPGSEAYYLPLNLR